MEGLSISVLALILFLSINANIKAEETCSADSNHHQEDIFGYYDKEGNLQHFQIQSKLALPFHDLVLASTGPGSPDLASMYYLALDTGSKLRKVVEEAMDDILLTAEDLGDEDVEEEISAQLLRLRNAYTEWERNMTNLSSSFANLATETALTLPVPSFLIQDIMERKFEITYESFVQGLEAKFNELMEHVTVLAEELDKLAPENSWFASSSTARIQRALVDAAEIVAPLLKMISPLSPPSRSESAVDLPRSLKFYRRVCKKLKSVYDRAVILMKDFDYGTFKDVSGLAIKLLTHCDAPGFKKFATELQNKRRGLNSIFKVLELELILRTHSFVTSTGTELEAILEGEDLSSKKRNQIKYAFEDLFEDIHLALPRAQTIERSSKKYYKPDTGEELAVPDADLLSLFDDGNRNEHLNYSQDVSKAVKYINNQVLGTRTILGHITANEEYADALQYAVVSKLAEFHDDVKMSVMRASASLHDHLVDSIELYRYTIDEILADVVAGLRNVTRDAEKEIRDEVDRICENYILAARPPLEKLSRPFGIFTEGGTSKLKTIEEALWEFQFIVRRFGSQKSATTEFQNNIKSLLKNTALANDMKIFNDFFAGCPFTVSILSVNDAKQVFNPLNELVSLIFSTFTATSTVVKSMSLEELKYLYEQDGIF